MASIKIDNIRKNANGLQQLKNKELRNLKGGTSNVDFKVTGQASSFAELTVGFDERISFEVSGHVSYHP